MARHTTLRKVKIIVVDKDRKARVANNMTSFESHPIPVIILNKKKPVMKVFHVAEAFRQRWMKMLYKLSIAMASVHLFSLF